MTYKNRNSIFLGWLKFYLKRFQSKKDGKDQESIQLIRFSAFIDMPPPLTQFEGGGAYYLLLVHLSNSHMYAISGISHKLSELGQPIIDDDWITCQS